MKEENIPGDETAVQRSWGACELGMLKACTFVRSPGVRWRKAERRVLKLGSSLEPLPLRLCSHGEDFRWCSSGMGRTEETTLLWEKLERLWAVLLLSSCPFPDSILRMKMKVDFSFQCHMQFLFQKKQSVFMTFSHTNWLFLCFKTSQ